MAAIHHYGLSGETATRSHIRRRGESGFSPSPWEATANDVRSRMGKEHRLRVIQSLPNVVSGFPQMGQSVGVTPESPPDSRKE